MEQSETTVLTSFISCFCKFLARKDVNFHLEVQRDFLLLVHPDGKINIPLQSRFILVFGGLKETCIFIVVESLAKHLFLPLRRVGDYELILAAKA